MLSKPITDARAIAVRAFTESSSGKRKRANRKRSDEWVAPGVEYILALDLETTIGFEHSLLVGFYRLCRIDWRDELGRLALLEEGLFVPDNLAAWKPEGLATVEQLVERHRWSPEIASVAETCTELVLRSRRDFVVNVLIPSVQGGAVVVAFNAPFDLSRLAERWSRARGFYYGGFYLELAGYRSAKTGRMRSLVTVRTRRIAPKRHVMEISVPHRDGSRRVKGKVLDLHTLGFALSNKDYSLQRAAEEFGSTVAKASPPEFGVITEELLSYARRDVEVTVTSRQVVDFHHRHPRL